ncbi:hypothetical protein TWF569_003559 [Orbilia oligospora]|nr:hypothetical protein TWF102_000643 [Orbilia oligospora]KAF3099248.1 hypothetical protein TWF103_008763 [Orbilia oligospora]KAF3099440.1 hypothetical protein TWF706_006540 [Orbilia oligospora]KAF3151846.1 hypothetical protein TWF569_003559 [Orbilia oligospora]
MATESANALSRSPTPTQPSNDTFDANSDNEDATNTDISSNSDDDVEDYNDDDEADPMDNYYYLSNAFWNNIIESLNAITKSSIGPSVGTSTTSLRKYYIRKITELSNRPEYDIPLTSPPCPYINLIAVDHNGADDDARLECPCCLPDELPRLKLIAEDIVGGVITCKELLQSFATWLYGPDQEEPLGLGQESELGCPVRGLPAGEAGVVKWNFMTHGKDPELGDAIMGLKLFFYFVKPLVEGGRFQPPEELDGGDDDIA